MVLGSASPNDNLFDPMDFLVPNDLGESEIEEQLMAFDSDEDFMSASNLEEFTASDMTCSIDNFRVATRLNGALIASSSSSSGGSGGGGGGGR